MGNSARQFTGWRIADAMRRCADPDLLSAWFVDHRAWRAAGSRRRFSFHSEYLDGYEAACRNQSEGTLREISVRSGRSYARLKSSLIEHLLAGRIVAWGRKDTSTGDLKAIPASAWRYLRISDIHNSVVREGAPAKTKIFDVQIFPIVESPNAIDRFADRTFVEAFQMSLVDDPQLNVLRKRTIAIGRTPASFGDEWPPYRAVWPVVLGQASDAAPAIGLAEKSDAPTIVKAANRIQRQRYTKLMSYLSIGRLVAEGISAADGTSVAIPRSIWRQDETYIDLKNGDLLEIDSRSEDRISGPPKILFTGLILRMADSVHRISDADEPRPAASLKIQKSVRNVMTKTTSRSACRKWLIGLIRASPTKRLSTKPIYWNKAQLQWPESLSRREFDRAWADAVDETGAAAWLAGGRPKKPPQAKPLHQ